MLGKLVAWIMIHILRRTPEPPANLSLFIRDYTNPVTGVTVSAETQRKILASRVAETTHGQGWNRPVWVTSPRGVPTLEYVRGHGKRSPG